MPEMRLQLGSTDSACGPFLKKKLKKQKIRDIFTEMN